MYVKLIWLVNHRWDSRTVFKGRWYKKRHDSHLFIVIYLSCKKECLTKYTSTLYYINICFSNCFYLMHNDVSCYATLSLRLFSVVALSLFVLYISWNIHRDSFSKRFFSLHTEIKVSSCDIYFADNMGETVRHLIGENHGHPRMCISWLSPNWRHSFYICIYVIIYSMDPCVLW